MADLEWKAELMKDVTQAYPQPWRAQTWVGIASS